MTNPVTKVSEETTRTYLNPPAHEVILDLQFHQELDDEPVQELRSQLAGQFGFDEVMEVTGSEIMMAVGASEQSHRVRKRFEGWSFRTAPRAWMLNARKKQLTLHVVRAGKWPRGRYVGWQQIRNRYAALYEALENTYSKLDIRRAGLRYLNRIAVPHGDDLDDWFTLRFTQPSCLDGLYSFDHKQTWASAGADDGIGVTLRLAMIQIEDAELAREHVGVLLDIDVFNLFIKDAPAHEEVLGWYERAHAAENAIFEASVTDLARKSFDNALD
jgi:uncharacterized protein (TIGR04255 family)